MWFGCRCGGRQPLTQLDSRAMSERMARADTDIVRSAGVDLPQLILHLGDAGLGAGFLLGLATRRAAQADGTDRVFADHDRNAATERNDLRKTTLAGDVAFGRALRPFGGGSPERERSIGLAAGKLEIVRRGVIALEKHAHPAGAIENGNRYARRAFGQCR